MLGTILIVVVVLMLFGALPRWGHSRNWGYGPSGGLGLVLVILVILRAAVRLARIGLQEWSDESAFELVQAAGGVARVVAQRVFQGLIQLLLRGEVDQRTRY